MIFYVNMNRCITERALSVYVEASARLCNVHIHTHIRMHASNKLFNTTMHDQLKCEHPEQEYAYLTQTVTLGNLGRAMLQFSLHIYIFLLPLTREKQSSQ